MATIGTILIQAANQAGSITGPNAPSSAGMGGGGQSSEDMKHQKVVEGRMKEQNEQGEKAPKFWTAAFKKMGIQMGLAGILKQSQIFTSTIGSLFQIFGAFVDVMLAPFVPLFIPAIRWLARQLPAVAKAAQWTADKLSKGVSAVWSFLSKVFSKNWVVNLVDKVKTAISAIFSLDWVTKTFGGVTSAIADAFSGVTDFFSAVGSKIKTHLIDPLWATVVEGLRSAWNSTLGNQWLGFGFGYGWRIPAWKSGSSSTAAVDDSIPGVPRPIPSPGPSPEGSGEFLSGGNTAKVVRAIDDLKTKVTGGDGSTGDIAVAGGIIAGLGTAANMLTTSIKLGDSRFGRNPNLDMPKGWKATRTGVRGWVDSQEMNPLRRLPGSRIVNTATRPIAAVTKAPAKLTLAVARHFMGLSGSSVDDAAQAARSAATSYGLFDTIDEGGSRHMNTRSPMGVSSGDDARHMKNKKLTQLGDAVQAFDKWVRKTGRGLGGAAKGGVAAFTSIWDEGFALAGDVVRLASQVKGAGIVGTVISKGFTKVMPGVAGIYMVGETLSDLWRMAKSDAPWLGDYTDLTAYTSEVMGTLFAKGHGFGGMQEMGLVGKPIEWLGQAQSMLHNLSDSFLPDFMTFGSGNAISDWQKNLTEKQQEEGILKAGKLMDMIARGTTGFTGAALSTFFPGLGSLAGGLLYEVGRASSVGLNLPFTDNQLGGNVEKYGTALDFTEVLAAAIKDGFGAGVNVIEAR